MPAFNSSNTRFPRGLTNAAPWQTMYAFGAPDPTWGHIDCDDFNKFLATDWTITKVGTGAVALLAGLNGLLRVNTTAGIADSTYLQRVVASYQAVAGKGITYKFAGTLSDVTNCTFVCGLFATAGDPLAANDGVYISKATGSGALNLILKIGGVVTATVPFPAACVLTAATAFELGFHIDSFGNVEVFWNPTTGASQQVNPGANYSLPVSRGRVASYQQVGATNLTQVLLNPTFGLLNTTAVARTLDVDYQVVAQNR